MSLPHILDQIPKSAKDYYSQSEKHPFGTLALIGKDDLGRKIYQTMFDGEEYGAPRALLSYAEYVRKVKDLAKSAHSLGVQRFTAPFFRN